MPAIKVTHNFKFAERGVEVLEFTAGETVEVSDECAEVAVTEKWAKLDTPTGKPRRAIQKIDPTDNAFENRETSAAQGAPETKA